MKSKCSVLTLWLIFCAFLFSGVEPGFAQRRVLSSLEEDITSLVESVKPSLVTIETEARTKRKKSVPSTFVGSGIIYTSDGYILTSASVAGGRNILTVTLPDQRSLKGKLVGTDQESNLAVLKVEATGLVPAKLGDSDKIRVGSWLTVVGNSYGLPNAVALGLVNGLRKDGFIQMSANVSPGNSGGPVLDTYGNVIGLVAAKLSEPSYIGALEVYSDLNNKKTITIPARQIEIPSSGVSLALPANKVRFLADRIIKYGTVRRGYLGIYPEDLDRTLAGKYGISTGVLVSGVVKGSPAQAAGLEDGDLIIEFGGAQVENAAHIRQLIKNKGAGENVELEIVRDGQVNKLSVALGASKPAYGYSWWTDFEVPEPPEDPATDLYLETAYEYLREAQGFKAEDKVVLDQLRQEIKKLTKDMQKMNEELQRLKQEKSR